MALRNTFRRTLIVASSVLVAACQDATPPSGPTANAAMSGRAQDRLEALFQSTSPEVMAIPGTVFSDNDERIGKLVIGVEHMQAARGVEARLAAHGVAKGEYEVILTEPIRQLATLRDVFRPTQAGIQIHYSNYVCSIGFNGTHSDGSRSMYTASHCTTTQGGVEGTKYYQSSSTIDPTVIATEVSDPVYTRSAGCPKGKACRWSDAARAVYSSNVASSQGVIAKTTGVNTTSLTTAGFFTVTSQDVSTTNFPIGTVMNKVGRTTGWSQGPVERTCINSSVQGSKVYLFCQTTVRANVAGGDSGSDVFRITSGDNVQLTGILWGGGTGYFVMSPLANVVRELGSFNAVK